MLCGPGGSSAIAPAGRPASTPQGDKDEKNNTTMMQPERTDLDPPKDDPFTQEQLKAYGGSDASKPIYVAIKGTVFDVSRKRETYGPGGSYAVLAGKDGSRALGLSSLKPEDAVADWSTLEEKERKTLDDWHTFFTKRYNIVGRVVDLPAAVANK
ncbi:Cytochrome b5-like heme/steroid binding domain containing protein [Russula decolorans]